MPVEPGPAQLPFGGRDLGVVGGPWRRGVFAALDLGALVHQTGGLLLAAALVLVMLPSFTTVAHAAPQRFYLHNYPTPPSGDTPAGRALPMNGTAPTATTLYQYSTDHFQGRTGRYVHKGSSNSAEGNLLYMTNWVYQVPQDMVLSGNALGGIWIGQKDGCNRTGTFHLFLRTKSDPITNTGTLLARERGRSPTWASRLRAVSRSQE